MVSLDLTHQVLATTAVQKKLLYGSSEGSARGGSLIRILFHDLLVFFAHTYRDVFGISDGPPLHDPLAVAIVLFDNGAEKLAFDDRNGERWDVKVVTDGLHSDVAEERGQVGRTVAARASGGGIRIPRTLNTALFWDVVDECLKRGGEQLLLKRPVA